jgi:hypothetical protein
MRNKTDFQRHAWLSGNGAYNSVVITRLTGLSLPILSSIRSILDCKPYVYSFSCCLLRLSPFQHITYKSVSKNLLSTGRVCRNGRVTGQTKICAGRQPRHCATLYTTKPLWNSLKLNPGFRAQKPATNLQRHCMTCYGDFNYDILLTDFFSWLSSPARAMASSFTRFLDHTQRRVTVGRTPLEEWSARRRGLYLTTHTTDIHAPHGIRTHDRSRRAAVDLRLRPRGHWNWLLTDQLCVIFGTPSITQSRVWPDEIRDVHMTGGTEYNFQNVRIGGILAQIAKGHLLTASHAVLPR